MTRYFTLASVALVLTACSMPDDEIGPASVASTVDRLNLGEIETTVDGQCFARMDQPTETSIIEELELVIPETTDAEGNVTAPPVYRTITRPQTLAIGEGERFETLCPPAYTPERVATLQRALRVRGAYAGPINGTLDTATGAAIRQFQRPDGIKSNLIEIDIARRLGVVATPID
ncbi:peptidoglycan-binding domain-containing protein [Yoonia sp. 208BN28-4]|uniref:peptidoglycan-binding domain-containing protein n=1 Tax=Yoonia sp. 208BN28-4 TaxID=3126505 RepID=UPI0030A5F529